MNFNFDNMNNPNEQPKPDDLSPEEVTAEEKLDTDIEQEIKDNWRKSYYGIEFENYDPTNLTKKRFSSFLETVESTEVRESLKPLLCFYQETRSLTMTEETREEFLKSDLGKKAIKKYSEDFSDLREEIDKAIEKGNIDIEEVTGDKLEKGDIIYYSNNKIRIFQGKYEFNLSQEGEEYIYTFYDLGTGYELQPEGRAQYEKDVISEKFKKIQFINKTKTQDNSIPLQSGATAEEKETEDDRRSKEPSLDETKNEEISPEVKNEIDTEQESNSTEMTEEEFAEIEEINKKEEEKFNSEKNARLEEWDNEENKEQKIAEEKINIEEELEKRVMKENKELIEQKNIKEILKSHDELRSLQNELKEEVKKSIEGRRAASEGIQNQLNQNVDISQLNIGDQMEVETARSEFLKTTKNVLSVKEIDYLLEIGNESGDLGDLSKTHEERKIEMEELQKIIKAIEEYKSFMEKFEKLTEEEREEAREEVGKLVEWLEWVKENKEDLFLALVAMGMITGVAALIMSVGLPADMAIPAFLTVKNAIITGAAVGAGYYLYKKEKIQAAVKTAGMAVALPIVGGAMILDSILSSKKLESWMETLCGTSLPSWAQDKKEKS